MPIAAAKKIPARKVATPRPAAKAAGPRARLTPPSAMCARDVMARYPAPCPDFDAAAVERTIAGRADR